MTGIVKRAVAGALHHTGALRWLERRRRERRGVVLAYHRISGDRDPFFPATDVGAFEAQLDYVRSVYLVEPLSRVLEWVRDGEPGTPRAAITIDDGYADTLEVALPRLRVRELPATLFLSTQPPEEGRPLWLDRLRLLFKRSPVGAAEHPRFGPGRHLLGTAEARLALLSRVAGTLKRAGASEVEDVCRELWQALAGDAIIEGLKPLRWDGVRALAEGGVEIGAHTHRHYVLANLSREEARSEIEVSLRLIRARLGRDPVGFAYPNGEASDYRPETLELLAELGVRWACTMRPGFVTKRSDLLRLPRLHTSMQTLPQFACRLAGLSRDTNDPSRRASFR